MSFDCPLPSPALTISGGHFGAHGAAVVLRGPTAEGGCRAVEHVPGRPDSVLICHDPALPAEPIPPAGLAVAVQVITQAGTSHTLGPAVVYAGDPRPDALVPLSPACVSAGARALTQCPGSGTDFAIVGEGLIGWGPTEVAVGGVPCGRVALYNASYVECLGATGHGDRRAVAVAVGVHARAAAGPPLTVSFADPCAARPGHWAAPLCVACSPGHYGPACALPCPRNASGAVCSGHGACDDGLGGSGACACDADAARGHWAGAACTGCRAGYAGPDCRLRCPSAAGSRAGAAVTCAGHGACTAAGACDCQPPWAGHACDVRCPADSGAVPCSGHGTCEAGPVPGVGVCTCATGVGGSWAGTACGGCAEGWVGPACAGACPEAGPLRQVCAGHGRCAWNGTAALCECDVTHVGPGCAQPCPRDARGDVCGAHGRCEAAAPGAQCACARDAAAGFWAGIRCDACAAGYAGLGCDVACPRGAAGAVCSGHGNCTLEGACACAAGHCGPACGQTGPECVAQCPAGSFGPQCGGRCACGPHGACQDGPYGSGVCACDAGWAGPRCDIACGGAAAGPPCGGHGQCDRHDGTCTCLAGWRTLPGAAACATPCPGVPGLPCGGRGACNATAHCACYPGYGGADCSIPCPRDAAGRSCAGHGWCSPAGRCACDRSSGTGHWAGAACSACAGGFFGPGCDRVCLAGETVGRLCVCAAGHAGADCGLECPGGTGSPCSGHGLCGAVTGLCECRAGYGGHACERECPRGGADGRPCAGHGACDARTGTCRCDDSSAGHWAGPACAACAGAYYGPACALLCPVDAAGARCAGHGACTGAGGCRCGHGPAIGYWAGPVCAECAPGHWGAECHGECPGGACRPCAGHGACHDGREGNGTCACHRGPGAGHWDAGRGCGDCLPGWYGPDCLRACPGGAGTPCGGHGLCSDGVDGSGACACAAGPATGFWAGADCGACAAGRYGADCAAECPGGAGGACSGAGVCADGRAGSGACTCDGGFVGVACERECPRGAGGAPCHGHGACAWDASAQAAACVCHAGAAVGYWGGDGCGTCGRGYYGPECVEQCPGGAARPCSAHGTCRDGVAGDGGCACAAGYAGPECGIACPGLSDGAVCGGHGRCAAATGACVCSADPSGGYWAGPRCGVCAEGWAGPACATACPRAASGAVCGARGACVDGACVCAGDACGAACELSGADCTRCDRGRWGADCQWECPGGAATACRGHGRCLDGAAGSGLCVCDAGYGTPDCGRACPSGDWGALCSGHGTCSAATALCRCDAGYAGEACGVACARAEGIASNPVCGGPDRGTCDDGATGSGRCACALGFAGSACDRECKGMGAAGPCHGHGACGADTGDCVCRGHWGGAECAACEDGWYGPDCGQRCFQGRSAATLCLCLSGWAAPDCSVECAGGAARPCGGHGVCNETRAGDGACACDAAWRGAACTVPCAGLFLTGRACAGHGTCNATGGCVCARSAAQGHWAGEACGRCAHGYAGRGCAVPCPGFPGPLCGGHGVCNAVTAACECYRGPEAGHWAEGSNCTDCAAGYWGPRCSQTCPGGTCTICSGHGRCAGGVNGTGACACDAHWEGAACSGCVPGRYGPGCNASCPAAPDAAGAPAVCAGHGVCLDGLYGSGDCVCAQSGAAGMWAGADCSACAAGYWGPLCAGACPRGSLGQICAGHGSCRGGRTGDGACVCAGPYGGPTCDRTCPAAGGRVCNGVGACDPERGRCDCGGARFGHWAGPACATCAEGYVGADCAAACPTGGAPRAVCAGHGRCAAVREAAQCACDSGYYGVGCAGECPGGALRQCSGHGTCDPGNGTCACARSAAHGHWAGAECGECASGWSGSQCRTPCPPGAGGVPCSGRPCRSGVCDCGDAGCGPGCNVTGPVCAGLFCPEGRWGADCAGWCPRNASGAVCSARGECPATTYGDGRCRCTGGYAGPDCGRECDGLGPWGVCFGAGDCRPADGTCVCYPGFAGPGCGLRCPLVGGVVCGGHGACNDTADGDGTCGCVPGHTGAACQLLCPGFDPAASDPVVCGGHGQCATDAALCVCEDTLEGAAPVPDCQPFPSSAAPPRWAATVFGERHRTKGLHNGS